MQKNELQTYQENKAKCIPEDVDLRHRKMDEVKYVIKSRRPKIRNKNIGHLVPDVSDPFILERLEHGTSTSMDWPWKHGHGSPSHKSSY